MRVLLLALYCQAQGVIIQAPAKLSPAPNLKLSCGAESPDCSESLPLHGNTAQGTVTFAETKPLPAWIRLDRCDHVNDNTVWVEYFPRWVPTAGGTFDFAWLAGSNASSITVTASGWSARFNGTQLTENSTDETAFFSFDYRDTTTQLEVEDTGPGSVRLTGKPGKGLNATAVEQVHWADSCDFSAYSPGPAVKGALNFAPSYGLHQSDGGSRCSISLAFENGGIYYYAIQAGRNGLSQASSSACIAWGAKCDHPLALVLPYYNGSVPALPAGFLGQVHHVTPLKIPSQFCINVGQNTPHISR